MFIMKIIFSRFVLLSLIFSFYGFNNAFAETIWCKNFGLGCKTEKEKNKDLVRCERLSKSTYKSAFNKALSDPSIWQLDGYESAQDYANKRMIGMYSICIKN